VLTPISAIAFALLCFFTVVSALNGAQPAGPSSSVPGWQAEWDRTVTAAKKEGKVNVYIFGGRTRWPIEAGIFQKRFPEVEIVTISGDPVLRIMAERRAGKYLADVVIGGSSTPFDLYTAKALDSIKDAMILPEVADESKWWQGKHRYIDPQRKYGFMYMGHLNPGGIHYNTKQVNPKEFQSFWDFLNPKWKGKIESRDVRAAGTGGTVMKFFFYHPKLGPSYIRRLFGEMDVTFFRDRRQGVDWLVTGKFPICLFCDIPDVALARSQGLPVTTFGFMKEGAGFSSGSGNIGFPSRAPHPNAAKVFINWFLSREGQLTVQREYSKAGAGVMNSLRIDIPKDMIPADQQIPEGVEYIDLETAERISLEPIIKLLNEAPAGAGK